MEIGHGTTVNKFLNKLIFEKPFSFLDIGRGNGWVIRKISQISECRKAVGIDKSRRMIQKARTKKTSEKEHYWDNWYLFYKINFFLVQCYNTWNCRY